MSQLPPLPPIPERRDPASLAGMDEAQLEEAVAEIANAERATTSAMAPHQAQLRELRARSGEIATERRRRERGAHIAARAAVREQARSGELPTLLDALATEGFLPDDVPLGEVVAFLRSGGEVRFGYPARPGPLAFSDGRTVASATTWGQARRLYADGWEPGSPTVLGVRVHLAGTRVERVVDSAEVVVRTST